VLVVFGEVFGFGGYGGRSLWEIKACRVLNDFLVNLIHFLLLKYRLLYLFGIPIGIATIQNHTETLLTPYG
jgi:hypothetical protein